MKLSSSYVQNVRLKAIALLLAIVSWGVVTQITNNETGITDVPVVINIPEGWAIRDQDVRTVDLTFRGTREDLLRLDERTIQLEVDLRDEEFLSTRSVRLTPRMVTTTASNARVTKIEPDTVNLSFGREGSKDLPVLVTQSGQPPQGLTIESIQVEPSVVTLYGEQEVLETVSSLQTNPLNVSDRIRSFEQRVEVKPPTESWVGRVTPSRVLVKVTLAGVTEERRFADIPLLTVHPVNVPVDPRAVAPETVDVFLEASPQLLDALEISDIRAFVSTDGRENERKPVQVLVPPGIDVLGVRPDTVRLISPPTPEPAPVSSGSQD
jgi:YbbR domain-containing protein